MQVSEIMTREPLRVRADAPLTAALALLALGDVRHLPVVDDEGLAGMLSERDVLGFLVPNEKAARERLEESLQRRVFEVMSEDVVTVSPDAEVRAVIDLLLEHRIGAVCVVEGKELVGIVSYVDVLKATRDDL